MTYVAPTFKTFGLSTFHLREDANHHAMTGALGWFFQTQDATATPVKSPIEVNNTTQTLTVPQNGVEIYMQSFSAFYFTEDSSQTTNFQVQANTLIQMPVMGLQYIYFKTTADVFISFAFKMLQSG